jgi:hypothetical protein
VIEKNKFEEKKTSFGVFFLLALPENRNNGGSWPWWLDVASLPRTNPWMHCLYQVSRRDKAADWVIHNGNPPKAMARF